MIKAKWSTRKSSEYPISIYDVMILGFIYNSNRNETMAICNYYGDLKEIRLSELKIDK